MTYDDLIHLFETIYVLRHMMFGEPLSRWMSTDMEMAIYHRQLTHELLTLFGKNGELWDEYRKFTNDIQTYTHTPTKMAEYGAILNLLEGEGMARDVRTYQVCSSALYYEEHDDFYSIYFVKYKRQTYVSIYKFGRYFHTDKHPPSKLLFCTTFKKLI